MHTITPRILPETGRAYRPRSARRVLCIFPRYAHSFGTFQYAYPLMPGVRAFMPPQGILLIAAYLPRAWEVRFVDENVRPATDADYQWAHVVFISGMHVQRPHIHRINDAAHRHNRLTVLGGPSVSACPDYYPQVDILHLGELGDATDALVRYLDETVKRPAQQLVVQTADRLPLEQFPQPAYHLLNMRCYFLGSIQFSSGCPFLCEFCDIPALYGRNPRIKTPAQVLTELNSLLAAGMCSAVYFVDDNFIANPGATRMLLPHLIDWQRRTGYQLTFSCEATLNLGQFPDILAQMREANFRTVFVGIETPEPEALVMMKKTQNMRQPILQSIKALNDHGLEVVSGIILGLDSDTPDTAQHILRFIETSRIAMLTINLLYALPKTTLYQRLHAENRLIDDPRRKSNVRFKLPYDQVVRMWRRVVEKAYDPAKLYDRFQSQTEICFPNRITPPRRRVPPRTALFGAGVISRTLWHVGVRADYRNHFWRIARPLLRHRRLEEVIHIGVVTHHLIKYARHCASSQSEASFYADPNRTTAPSQDHRINTPNLEINQASV